MKRMICAWIASVLCFIFCSSAVAADGDALKRFKPSISLGYAYMGGTNLVLDGQNGAVLLGANKIDIDIPDKHGSFIAGDFQFNFTDRLNLTVGGRIANALTRPGSHEEYNNASAIGRDWESDKQFWLTGDVMVSYAFLKNVSFVKNISGVAGLRWDYSSISFKNPTNASGVISASTDKVDLKVSMVSPVIGVSSTFDGFRSGIFGGDIKVGLLASPFTSGRIKYKESFNPAGTEIEADDNFYKAMMFSLSAEAALITAKIGPKAELLVSIYGQYTRHFIDSDIELSAVPGGTHGDFNFSMKPSMAIAGVKASIEF